MSLAPGTRFGPYEIQAAVGAGGMGEVYRARDTRLDRTVAIKVLPEALASEPQFHERFEREARSLAALNHAHICQVFDVGRERGLDFLVLEYLEGETLSTRLERGALPVAEAMQIAIETCDALTAAHCAGIVHRDLKPGNIMLTKGGAKLLDFGLAKAAAPAVASTALSMLPTTPPGKAGLTEQGTILGTFQYMAPEQLEGKEADARTDIFAFGAVLYEMLTGRKAFEGKSHASLIGAIMHADPAPVSTLQPLAPRSLDRVVRKCLAKDPDERWQSARDLLDELRWITEQGEPGVASTTVRVASATSGARTRLAWSVAAVALVVAAFAVAAAVYMRTSAPEPAVTRLDVVTPPTSDPFSFGLSPDGRQLVYVANGERGSQLWLRRLDEAVAQPLAGTEGASFPFWAPDSRAMAFFADGRLKRLNIGAGAPQVLAAAATARGGTWNREGVIVFGQASPGALMRVAATGGTPAALTQLAAGQANHRWPQFLPDGRRILFFVSGDPSVRGVYVGTIDGGEPAQVMTSDVAAVYAPPGYLLRVSQGILTAQRFDATSAALTGEPIPLAQNVREDDGLFHSAFTVSDSGVVAHRGDVGAVRQLVWVDRTGKLLGTIGEIDQNSPSHPELSFDDRRVTLTRTVQGNVDVWVTDVERALATRFTFDAATDSRAIWSPDGRRIAFTTIRAGSTMLFEKAASGEGKEQPLVVGAEPKAVLD
jgi:dipeptidyl aminopeptidase/acylaminoacyl peptidase